MATNLDEMIRNTDPNDPPAEELVTFVKDIVNDFMRKGKKNKKPKEVAKVGFARGLKPEKVLGLTRNNNKIFFLIQWKGCGEADLCPAEEAHEKCPQLVIRYFEERITWKKD